MYHFCCATFAQNLKMQFPHSVNRAFNTEQLGRPAWGCISSSGQQKAFPEQAQETQRRQSRSACSPKVFSSLIQSGFWLIQPWSLQYIFCFSLQCVCGHYPYKCHYRDLLAVILPKKTTAIFLISFQIEVFPGFC